jgi:uncharacterized membrane protein
MDWVAISLASAASLAVVSILDKIILTRHVPSPSTLIAITGFLQVPSVVIILLIVGFPDGSLGELSIAYLSGFIWGLSLVVMFWVLNKEEVSRVVPVYQTSPIFVAILAVFFLSESLSALQWVAILITVTGAGLVSFRRVERSRRVAMNSPYFFLIIASFFAAIGQFLSKVSLDDFGIWDLYAIRNMGMITSLVLMSVRVSTLREIRSLAGRPASLGMIVLAEGVIAFGAVYLVLWAIDMGPVSLVATVMSSRPLFVLGFSILLSSGVWHLLNEPLDRRTLSIKLSSTLMIVGGISAISLL